MSPSVKASLLCTFAFKYALQIELSACILDKTEYFAQSCREGLRGTAACINIWVTPPPQYNHLLCSLWDSHLSLWEKESRILAAFTCLNKNLHLGASPWHLRSLTETAVWTECDGKPAGGFSLQLFYCRQNGIQVHAALVLSSYSSIQNSSFQNCIIMELHRTCT